MTAIPDEILAESSLLFDDVRAADIDPVAHASFVIARVLDRGTLRSVAALLRTYDAARRRARLLFGGWHGHRRSIDFDFFRAEAFDGFALQTAMESLPSLIEWMPSSAHTLNLRIDSVDVSFFRYPYPLLAPTEPTTWGFGLASDLDIAAMKLEAIAGRGSRKDFVDLRLLCAAGLGLERIFTLCEQKYGTHRTDRYHRSRALAFFADAEQQPPPDMLVPHDWEETKAYFTAEARRLLAAGLAS